MTIFRLLQSAFCLGYEDTCIVFVSSTFNVNISLHQTCDIIDCKFANVGNFEIFR